MAGSPSRRKLVARLWRAVEREIAAIEMRLAGIALDDPAREDGAKQLGLLARLIRDLAALDEAKPRKPAPATVLEDEDAAFANLVSLRTALEKRLETLAAEEEA